jgi:hypothetical protein
MQTLKMKIHSYDDETHSLIVSYASDETASSDPASYTSYAYQPMTMWPDITDAEELVKRIGQAGVHMAEQQKVKESFAQNQQLIDNLKSFVGQEKTYSVADLLATSESYPNEVNI